MEDPRILPAVVNTLHMVKRNIDVYYPLLTGLKSSEVQQKINHTVLELINYLIKKQGYYENSKTEITGTYEIKNNQRGVLSESIINYAFAGGAHGLTYVKSLTMDINTGEMYKLKDLFKPGSDYIKRLSDIVIQQIKDRNIVLLGEFENIRPDQDFYVADKVLVIYFQQYEITPYYQGFPDFPINLYEIQDIISEDGPLAKLISSF